MGTGLVCDISPMQMSFLLHVKGGSESPNQMTVEETTTRSCDYESFCISNFYAVIGSQSCPKLSAPRRGNQEYAHAAHPNPCTTGTYSGPIPWPDCSSSHPVQDCSTMERPAKYRYFLALVFPQFGPTPWMASGPSFAWSSGELSGNTPGRVQRPCLITAIETITSISFVAVWLFVSACFYQCLRL